MKEKLYKEMLNRVDYSHKNKYYLESIWYIYAIIEDRLISALKQTGGHLNRNGNPIRMLGNKILEINSRKSTDTLLKANFDNELMLKIENWKNKRDNLMHAMADSTMSLEEIDKEKYLVSLNGISLVKSVCSSARRLKKHKKRQH